MWGNRKAFWIHWKHGRFIHGLLHSLLNAVLRLGQRRRRWANINPALGAGFVLYREVSEWILLLLYLAWLQGFCIVHSGEVHVKRYPVWLGRLTHLLREVQSHWPPFCFHSQLCKNDTRAAYQKTRMPCNLDEYFKCLRKLAHFQHA